MRDTDELRKRLLVATWAEFQHSVVNAVDQWQKDWKHVSVQKVVTLNICCNVACLTFHLPHIAQPVLFRATNVWRNATYLQSDEKFVHFIR